MKVYGDIERVDLASGKRWRRVSGDGESRLVPELDEKTWQKPKADKTPEAERVSLLDTSE